MTNEAVLKNDPELQRVLAACLDYTQSMLGVICYSWALRRYEEMFGGWFHQSRLAKLERLGFLAKEGEPSRGRRYYRIIARIELGNISGGRPKHKPLTEVTFPCPDCGQVLGPVTPTQLQVTGWPHHALFSQRHRRALGYESRNG